MHVFYLHGFASSPQSSKATFFADRLRARGLQLHCPDFNQPDFATLTVTRMLRQLDDRICALPSGEVLLIGSSLGGFVAVEAAAARADDRRHPVSRVVLLAPAVELEWERWSEIGPGGVEAWRKSGEIELFHFAFDEPRWLQFGFYEDAIRYQPAVRQLPQPVLIFQGRCDDSVTPALVERFAGRQPQSTLHLVDDGHQLKDSLEFIWRETAPIIDPCW